MNPESVGRRGQRDEVGVAESEKICVTIQQRELPSVTVATN